MSLFSRLADNGKMVIGEDAMLTGRTLEQSTFLREIAVEEVIENQSVNTKQIDFCQLS